MAVMTLVSLLLAWKTRKNSGLSKRRVVFLRANSLAETSANAARTVCSSPIRPRSRSSGLASMDLP